MSKAIQDILNDEKKFNAVAKAAFDSVDTDGSGEIDRDELQKVMNNIADDMGTEPPSDEDIKEVFTHLDTDKSGKIDFKEFCVLIRDVLNSMLDHDNN